MQSGLDSGTPAQFGSNKGVLRSALRADAFRLAALHIKQAGLSVSAQAPRKKVCMAEAETLRIVALEFLHRERLTNTKHDSSVHVSVGESLVIAVESREQKDVGFFFCSNEVSSEINVMLFH